MSGVRFNTGFKVFNSLTRTEELISTTTKGVLNWYACGPTVYDRTHIGHARTFVSLDIIHRIIKFYCNDMRVNLLMGITDIDDKIIEKSLHSQRPFREITAEFEGDFLTNLRRLNILFPSRFTRVSENIEAICNFIQTLMQKKLAYRSEDGGIYFDVTKFQSSGFKYPKFRPDNNCPRELNSFKRDAKDFALWKPVKPNEPSWPSPFGEGRPGWHIECSSMVHTVFGDKIDLHSGGIDLEFPHHENEIAQSEAFYGNSPWCPHFIHTGHLFVNEQKMSKSLKNFIAVDEFLEKFSADQFRALCLLVPYRGTFEYSEVKVQEACIMYSNICSSLQNLQRAISTLSTSLVCSRLADKDVEFLKVAEDFSGEIRSALMNDFNWTLVFRTLLVNFLKESTEYASSLTPHPLVLMQAVEKCQSLMRMFGFLDNLYHDLSAKEQPPTLLIEEAVQFRSKIRSLALSNVKNSLDDLPLKMLEECDRFRQTVKSHGISINDFPSRHSTWKWS